MGKHSLFSDSEVLNSAVEDLVADYVQNQPWYKKNANTITTTVGIALTMASSLAASGLDLPPWVNTSVLILGAVGTILGVKKTPNGVQESMSRKLAK